MRVLIVAAAVALLAAGCSNGAPRPLAPPPSTSAAPVAATSSAPRALPTPTPTPLAFYQRQYLALVAPPNALIAAMPDSPTVAQLAALADATQKMDVGMLHAQWPSAKVSSDVEAMVRADGLEIGDLNDPIASRGNLARDASAATAAAQIVRVDLGLPPVK